MKKKFRLAVLVSGRGSNLRAIQENIKSGKLDAEIVLVLSDNPEAKALDYAKEQGIESLYIDPAPYKTKLEGIAEDRYIEALQRVKPDLIVLAGFMRVIKSKFINTFRGRIINIHPSLLPKYPGLNTHQRAIEAGEKESGCTVHFVNEEVDGGKRIIQAVVPIKMGDTPNTLAARVLKKEHEIFSEAIRMIAEGRVSEESCPDKPIIRR